MQQLICEAIITTFTLEFILAVDLHYVADFRGKAGAGIHQLLRAGLTPKLRWSQECSNTKLDGRRKENFFGRQKK